MLDNGVDVNSNLSLCDIVPFTFIIFCYIAETLETLAAIREAREVGAE